MGLPHCIPLIFFTVGVRLKFILGVAPPSPGPLCLSLVVISLIIDFRFDGHIDITADVTSGTSNDGFFTVKVAINTIDESSVTLTNLDTSTPVTITQHSYDLERETHSFGYDAIGNFAAKLGADFSGPILTDSTVGFFAFKYPDRASGGSDRYISSTDFETNDARKAFPCIDEPGFKATFNVSIGRNSTLKSWANTKMASSGQAVPGYPGFVWDVYEITPIMSSYLVAFAVGEFDSLVTTIPGSGVEWETLARPGKVN